MTGLLESLWLAGCYTFAFPSAAIRRGTHALQHSTVTRRLVRHAATFTLRSCRPALKAPPLPAVSLLERFFRAFVPVLDPHPALPPLAFCPWVVYSGWFALDTWTIRLF